MTPGCVSEFPKGHCHVAPQQTRLDDWKRHGCPRSADGERETRGDRVTGSTPRVCRGCCGVGPRTRNFPAGADVTLGRTQDMQPRDVWVGRSGRRGWGALGKPALCVDSQRSSSDARLWALWPSGPSAGTDTLASALTPWSPAAARPGGPEGNTAAGRPAFGRISSWCLAWPSCVSASCCPLLTQRSRPTEETLGRPSVTGPIHPWGTVSCLWETEVPSRPRPSNLGKRAGQCGGET